MKRESDRKDRKCVNRARAQSFDRCVTSGLIQHRTSAIHGLHVTLQMLRVNSDKSDWFWFQSIVYKAIQNRNVVGPGQRSRFLVLTKRSAASGDENVGISDWKNVIGMREFDCAPSSKFENMARVSLFR